MKQLPDGGKAFYQNAWSLRLNGIICSLLAVFFLFQFAMSPKDTPLLIFIVIWAVFAAVSLYKGFFAKPLCVVYPEKILVYEPSFFPRKPTELFWDQIKSFYLQEKWLHRGKHSIFTKVLVLDTAIGLLSIEQAFQLKKQDRADLFRVLQEHGIAQEPDVDDKNTSDFMRNLFLKW